MGLTLFGTRSLTAALLLIFFVRREPDRLPDLAVFVERLTAKHLSFSLSYRLPSLSHLLLLQFHFLLLQPDLVHKTQRRLALLVFLLRHAHRRLLCLLFLVLFRMLALGCALGLVL